MTEHSTIPSGQEHNFTNRVVKIFPESNLSIILILLAAVVGVEYVYSMSRQDRTIIGGSSQLRAPRLGAGSRVHAARFLPRDHPRSGGACRSTDPGIPAEPIGGQGSDAAEEVCPLCNKEYGSQNECEANTKWSRRGIVPNDRSNHLRSES